MLTSLCTVLGGLPVLAQGGPLAQAQSALEISHPLPPGWTVKKGTDTGGAPAATDPDTKTITVNPDAISANYPNVNSSQANLPGVLYVVLLHEWYHANEECGGCSGSGHAGGGGSPPYNTTPRDCGDVQLTPGIAAQHCELICDVLNYGDGKIEALCALYKDIQKNYNDGTKVPGGASTVQQHCPGQYPGDIPNCSCCP